MVQRKGAVLVFDAADDYFNSRDIFQQLYSYAAWAKIGCVTQSSKTAKKMLLSREARYSGLIDALDIIETPSLAEADGALLVGYDTWVVVNAQAADLPATIAAAKREQVVRILLTVEGAFDAAALEGALVGSGIAYTVIRTGALSKDVGGSPLVGPPPPLERARPRARRAPPSPASSAPAAVSAGARSGGHASEASRGARAVSRTPS